MLAICDTIDYSIFAGWELPSTLATGTARGGDADGDTIVDMGDDRIENVRGSMHDDTLTGDSGMNMISGVLAGNDDAGRRQAR